MCPCRNCIVGGRTKWRSQLQCAEQQAGTAIPRSSGAPEGQRPVMRVATYERGRLRFWTDPFEINVSNEFHFFTPSDSVQDVTLFAKYTLRADDMFLNRMIVNYLKDI